MEMDNVIKIKNGYCHYLVTLIVLARAHVRNNNLPIISIAMSYGCDLDPMNTEAFVPSSEDRRMLCPLSSIFKREMVQYD